MREVVFLKKNESKWQKTEQLISGGNNQDPDLLANLYLELNDDLAYSQTNYPGSATTLYLNGLTSKIYQALYKRKVEKRNRVLYFWKEELPLAFYQARKKLLISFVVFTLSMLIGSLSTAYDTTYPKIILGESYVEMTLQNIENGDPLAVYKDAGETNMFFMITINNIKVSFLTFLMGIFFSFGTYYILFTNGVMVGTFQYFFYTKGLFATSFLTIWIHGTIEISSIIIAGAAGMALGNSLIYPGSKSRKRSLIDGTKLGTKIIIGLIPLFIMAGFLESFVTRHTDWHWSIRLGIILSSLAFIIFYTVIWPRKVHNKISLSN